MCVCVKESKSRRDEGRRRKGKTERREGGRERDEEIKNMKSRRDQISGLFSWHFNFMAFMF